MNLGVYISAKGLEYLSTADRIDLIVDRLVQNFNEEANKVVIFLTTKIMTHLVLGEGISEEKNTYTRIFLNN